MPRLGANQELLVLSDDAAIDLVAERVDNALYFRGLHVKAMNDYISLSLCPDTPLGLVKLRCQIRLNSTLSQQSPPYAYRQQLPLNPFHPGYAWWVCNTWMALAS